MRGIDKLRNTAEQLTGQGKENAGGATGDQDLQAEGQGDQAKADLEPTHVERRRRQRR